MRRLCTLVGTMLLACMLAGGAAAQSPTRWRAVIVAGDPSLPVWDNATRQLARALESAGLAVPGQVQRLTARQDQLAQGARPGSLFAALKAIAAMRPAAGEGCLVYLTMHGAPNAGLVFMPAQQVLTPDDLDAALEQGCGEAPTLVVASGCYTGGFARGRMARENRVVMTAARADRSSFGCGADFEMTVFDACLLGALGQGGAVPAVWQRTTACVEGEERSRKLSPPSGPQLHVGARMQGLGLPPLPAR
jgi:hypothetical protein